MVVSIRLETSDTFKRITQDLEREAPKRVYRKIAPMLTSYFNHLLSWTLSREPPPRNASSPMFVWSTDPTKQARARRWFFANYPNGYKRTHQMSKAWETNITLNEGGLTFTIDNPTPGASYVYGSDQFGQVPGHVTTGWLNAGKVFVDIGAETEDDVERLWYETIQGIVGK